MKCMACEHPDWGFIECYREVTGIEWRLLERLCEKHKNKILALEITEEINIPKPEPKKKPKLQDLV